MDTSKEVVQKNVASIVPWEQVCRMLDKVQSATRDKKKEMLLKFTDKYRSCLTDNTSGTEDSFFPVLRILLPGLDRDRGAYGVKERKLAELYIKTLAIRKGSVDAEKLLNYSKPKVSGSGAGDFADVAFYILKNYCPRNGSLSLDNVDKHLNNIAESHASKDQASVEKSLLQMLRNMSANEQKWLIRVLLKDLRLGLGHNAIFSAWHPDAKDYYDFNNSLAKVCRTLRDPSVRLHEIEISLFSPFRPMLAERAVLDKVEAQMKHKTYYVETKYDGERSQIHKRGNQYKYFSRNGFDFSSNFGSSPSGGLFTPFIHPLFSPTVDDVILDGEIIGWSQKLKTFVTKGEHIDVKNLKEDGDWQVCFCAFDILYLNGRVLTNQPLKDRIKLLSGTLSPMEGRVVITNRTEVTTKDDVVEALNEAIDRREEGVVLKDPDSVYHAASRKAGWIKVKPDYVDSCVPELDLLIVGGYYGKGRRGGIISHFLLAVAEQDTGDNTRPRFVHSVCRVGSGYSASELQDLVTRLTRHTTLRQPSNVLVSKEKPHVWFVPQKSCVVQVRAAEIVKSDMYKTGVTLRFPRVERIRSDKSWFEVLTTEELRELAQASKGKLALKHSLSGDSDGPVKKRVARGNQQPALPEYFRPADTSNVVKKGNLFAGKEFCVIDGGGGDLSKHQLETLVVENGATFSQHPGKNTFCIVCSKLSVRVQNLIRSGCYNVLRPSWVSACVEAGTLLSWNPAQVFHLLPDDRMRMEAEFDRFGDSFFAGVDPEKLKRITELMTEPLPEISPEERNEIDLLISEWSDGGAIFRKSLAFFTADGENEDASCGVIRLKFRLYGGRIDSVVGSNTTHVVVTSDSKENAVAVAKKYGGTRVVAPSWIWESVQN